MTAIQILCLKNSSQTNSEFKYQHTYSWPKILITFARTIFLKNFFFGHLNFLNFRFYNNFHMDINNLSISTFRVSIECTSQHNLSHSYLLKWNMQKKDSVNSGNYILLYFFYKNLQTPFGRIGNLLNNAHSNKISLGL